jgi:thiamine kinase-like enzyme
MWRVETDLGIYAVKQLSNNIDLKDISIINNYNLTEEIAARFIKQGIPAVCAKLISPRKYLIILEATGFLVYPWSNARALDKDKVSEQHALKIAGILAQMHLINLDVAEILEPEFDLHPSSRITELANRATEHNCSFASLLNQHLPELITINEAYHNSISILKKHIVVSHGDLDQKNVLWDESDQPILIDWESARKLNPTYEIVGAALDWSGITTEFNKELFCKIIEAYKTEGGVIDPSSFEAAFYGCLGNYINWMVYNIERACCPDNPQQNRIGVEQVTVVLPTIIRLRNLIPELINVIEITDTIVHNLIAEQ